MLSIWSFLSAERLHGQGMLITSIAELTSF